jgi:hypothetical protein
MDSTIVKGANKYRDENKRIAIPRKDMMLDIYLTSPAEDKGAALDFVEWPGMNPRADRRLWRRKGEL